MAFSDFHVSCDIVNAGNVWLIRERIG